MDVLHGNAFDLLGQAFDCFGIIVGKMYCQDVLTRIIFFDADTRHSRLTKQEWRVSSLYLAYLFFFSDHCLRKVSITLG